MLVFNLFMYFIQFSFIQAFYQKHSIIKSISLRIMKNDNLMEVKNKLLKNFESPINDNSIYADPESLKPLIPTQRFYGPIKKKYFLEPEYGSKYDIIPYKYYDLVTDTEKKKSFWNLSTREKVGQKFFQLKFISNIYERGYRQNFENFGFPGIDLEFEEAKDFFLSANATKVILDLSCGSGFMTRKFINSKLFDRVIAADLSPSMLAETRKRCTQENLTLPEFVRCDSESISAIHAGAAMHCWPNLNQSLAEVFRVLKPGGAFYASTFFTRSIGERDIFKVSANNQGFYLFSSEQEIFELVTNAGFNEETGSICVVRKEGSRCAIIKAVKASTKPSVSPNTNNNTNNGNNTDKTSSTNTIEE